MPTPIDTYVPDAARELGVVQATAARTVDPRLLDLMTSSAAQLIGLAGVSSSGPAANEAERDIVDFVEQFVIDVSAVSDPQRNALRRHIPEADLRAFVSSFYVVEFGQRLELMAPRLDLSLPDASDSATGPDIVAALRDYQAAVMREATLDPVTMEMVRLRCARVHNCRICKTLRLDRAYSVGVDESMTSKVDFYEQSDLSPRVKRALRITDAFITRPDTLADETAEDAIANLSGDQRASLLLSITKWSTQKIHVALGTDSAERLPTNSEGVSYFDFEEDGQVAGYSATPS